MLSQDFDRDSDRTGTSLKLQSGTLPQGDDVVEDNRSMESTTQQINVSFSDENSGEKNDLGSDISYLMSSSNNNLEITKFLERPVLARTQSWLEGTTFTDSISPWAEIIANLVMRRKFENYYLMRANLNVKVVINASPFYYGGVLVSYDPLPFSTQAAAGEFLVPFSQRPHFYIYPQNNQGGEMKIPFVYNFEWLDITNSVEVNTMGTLHYNAIGALRNANDVVGANVTIQTYVWLSEIELEGATSKLVLQSGKTPMKDEYQKEGAVSKPASAVARGAGMMSKVPIIGPFMTATSVAASAVANVASLFGFTDVPVIDDVHAFKNTPFPQMATTDVGVQFEKLSIDAKNELSIDPKICGVPADDELQLSTIVQRESYLTTFPWSVANVAESHLFSMRIFPELKRVTALSGGSNRINYTPMGYVAEAFAFWRGDIKIRLKFLCSQYHRGRVLIVWDPVGTPTVFSQFTNEVCSQVIDLAECSDVEINIPWTQPEAYKRTGASNPLAQGFSTASFATDAEFTNGNLSVYVLNELTAPSATADIEVAVFVKGGDNLEFSNPKDIDPLLSPYTLQSGTIPMDGPLSYDTQTETLALSGKQSTTDPNFNLVYNGENVSSVRQMIRRSNFYSFMPFSQDVQPDTQLLLTEVILPRLPLYPGYDISGIQLARNNSGAGNVAYNWVTWTYLSWFQLMYIGIRGSVNYMVNKDSARDGDTVFLERSVSPDRGAVPTFNTFAVGSTGPVTDIMARLLAVNRQPGESGVAVTSQKTQASVTASIPFYSRYKFTYTNPIYRTDGLGTVDSEKDSIIVGTTSFISEAQKGTYTQYQAFDLYMSAGTDMTFIFFKNAPCMVRYGSVPAAAS